MKGIKSIISSTKEIISQYPFNTQVGISTAKSSASDFFVQKQVEKKPLKCIDWRRNLAFTAFGFGYGGIALWYIYVRGFRRLFDPRIMDQFCALPIRAKLRHRGGLVQVGQQLALDFLVIQPFVTWPVFYMFKESFQHRDSHGEVGITGTITNIAAHSLSKYRLNFWEDNIGMIGFWFPASLVIYTVPIQYRLPGLGRRMIVH
mmetsp:Transcript_30491/g.74271  ORF Transcript_30491/g.74271 Transcript_30491/m.74271 type:complete len:203 (-) Transcript_30491:231-839(-)